jgi:hypothetical protein
MASARYSKKYHIVDSFRTDINSSLDNPDDMFLDAVLMDKSAKTLCNCIWRSLWIDRFEKIAEVVCGNGLREYDGIFIVASFAAATFVLFSLRKIEHIGEHD